MAWSLATPHPPLPCDAALAHAALLRTLVQVAVQQELTLPVWQAVRGRVVSQADGQAVVLFQLNGVTYVADPTGAAFSIWQPGEHKGAGVANEPNTWSWNELNTRDLEGAHAFYGAVFGWQFRHSSIGEMPYLVAKLNETPICGIQPMTAEDWPADMSPHWMVYFAVHNCDRSAEHALALGGRVLFPPMSLAIGRYAVLMDPQGGMFAVLASNR